MWCKDQPLKEGFQDIFNRGRGEGSTSGRLFKAPQWLYSLEVELHTWHKIGSWIALHPFMLSCSKRYNVVLINCGGAYPGEGCLLIHSIML